MQDASLQEFGIAMPSSGPSITATYGADPALAERVLASVRRVVPQAAKIATQADPVRLFPAERRAIPTPAPGRPTVMARLAATASPAAATPPPPEPVKPPESAKPSGVPRPSEPAKSAKPAVPASPSPSPSAAPAQSALATAGTGAQPSPALTASHGPQAGFDTCTAPSLQAMHAWRAKFSVIGIYIGGEEMACDYGNLSAAWVHAVRALGWSMLPTYVGPQAPCDSFSGKVDPKHAAAQGRQNAQWAVQDAAMFGLGKGSPIYYDMEAYNDGRPRCVTAVLTFLDAWTRQLNAEGYVSGVYSSAGSAVIDLANTTKVAGHPLAEPQAIWFALWDNASDLNGTPYLPAGIWPSLHRSKQFVGSHWVKVRHIGLDIDSDLVNSAVAR
jgi:hypothetical protein